MKKNEDKTNAMRLLDGKKIKYSYHTYVNNCAGTIKVNLESGNTYIINIIATLEDAKVEDNVN